RGSPSRLRIVDGAFAPLLMSSSHSIGEQWWIEEFTFHHSRHCLTSKLVNTGRKNNGHTRAGDSGGSSRFLGSPLRTEIRMPAPEGVLPFLVEHSGSYLQEEMCSPLTSSTWLSEEERRREGVPHRVAREVEPLQLIPLSRTVVARE